MIHLLRHGAVADNGDGNNGTDGDAVRRFIGRTDLPLSETGRRQARQWAGRMAGIDLAGIFCSDLSRSAETARIIAGGRPIPLTPIPALSEIHLGQWEGRAMADIRRLHPDQWTARGSGLAGFRPPGGESFGDLAERVIPAFERIAAIPGNTLIVAHAGVNRVIICHILKMPLQRLFSLEQSHGGLNLIRPMADGFRVLALNLGIHFM